MARGAVLEKVSFCLCTQVNRFASICVGLYEKKGEEGWFPKSVLVKSHDRDCDLMTCCDYW